MEDSSQHNTVGDVGCKHELFETNITATGTRIPYGSHSVTCHPAEVTFPRLHQPAKAGTQFYDPEVMSSWLVTHRLTYTQLT